LGPGSGLLNQLALIQHSLPWIGFLRYLGTAFHLIGITVALTVIIRTLQFQEQTLKNFIEARS
jgi:hypothetical protein